MDRIVIGIMPQEKNRQQMLAIAKGDYRPKKAITEIHEVGEK